MRHLESDQWSRGGSALHRCDARAKLAAVLTVLAFVGTARPWHWPQGVFYGSLALAALLAAQLSWAGFLRRLSVVLPVTATFALLTWLSTGDAGRAGALLSRSLVSVAFAIVLIATTPAHALLTGAERLGAPRMLVAVAQMVHRYLFVLIDQALRMRQAARSRGGFRWSAAAGAAAALLLSSEQRATRIHQAMLARGFTGTWPELSAAAGRWNVFDSALAGGTALTLLLARLLWRL
ncbi:MAG: hypothetical protein FJW31_00130 [Acidobacteria bacterium]|nr:hypothetical protein [Acidobacteriota bacterium]